MRRTLLFIALIFTALGAKAQNSEPSRTSDIKVISYNIRLGVANDGSNSWAYRRPATIAMLEEQTPDVFGVQEAHDFQISFITENLPQYCCVGIGREDGAHKGEHMSIFYDSTKVELLDWGTYWLSETPSRPSKSWGAACKRTATWTKMKMKDSGKQFFYVNTHLDHVSALARKNGLALVVGEIGAMNAEGLPMILTGDFNIPPSSDNLTDLNGVMKSARTCAEDSDGRGSFNGWGKYGNSDSAPVWEGDRQNCPMLIDYIYYSGFSTCTSFKVLDRKYVGVPYISDHWPVTATLVF